MNHPKDDLYPYLVDELSPNERARLEAHLADCAECRRELELLDEAYVAMIERLPAEAPPARVWAAIEQRTGSSTPAPASPPPPARPAASIWPVLALAASLVVASVGVLWGVDQRQTSDRLRAEHAVITEFLAQSGVSTRTLPIDTFEHGGSVLFALDGSALVVMRHPAPPNRSYQAWGLAGDRVESLGVLDRTALRVTTEGFDVIAVSLEPEGGSPQPTEVLGGVPTS